MMSRYLGDPVIREVDGDRRLVNPATGSVVSNAAEFCRINGLVRQLVPFAYTEFDVWEYLAAIKRAYEESPVTLKTMASKRLYDTTCEYYHGELPGYDSMSAMIRHDVLVNVGVYLDPDWQESRWLNPYYCHPRPSPPREQWLDEIVCHLELGTIENNVCDHLGLDGVAALNDFCREAVGYEYTDMVQSSLQRRRNTVALSVLWGSDPETIAYVEETSVDAIERVCDSVHIDPAIVDPTKFSLWWYPSGQR